LKSAEDFPVKRTTILAAVVFAVVLASLGCGTSDKLSTLTISSKNATGTFEVKGEGGTLQLKVVANYTSGKAVDVTNFSTLSATAIGLDLDGFPLAAPPQTIQISDTAMVTAVQPFDCTFTLTSDPGVTPPSYALTGSYQITASYKGFTSQPTFLGVASATGNGPGAACGP
jgi:hypothetical protein